MIQQTVLVDYRVAMHEILFSKYESKCLVCCGQSDFDGTIQTAPGVDRLLARVTNHYFWNRRLLWQAGRLGELVAADAVILNFNLRTISNWLILGLRRLRGKRTVLWGHIKGRSALTEKFRFLQLNLADGFVAYTHADKRALQNRHARLKSWAASNSAMRSEDCFSHAPDPNKKRSIICVGRLVAKKKPTLLLEAFVHAVSSGSLDDEVDLVFIGEGPERGRLEKMAQKWEVLDRVILPGHVSDVGQLRSFYAQAVVSVSPGYVGLSAIQSFGFGLTMLVARDEKHSPEIEACIEGQTALFFPSGDSIALSKLISSCASNVAEYDSRRQQLCEFTRESYTIEAMVAQFEKAIEFCCRPT